MKNANYQKAIHSPHWQNLKEAATRRAGNCCEECLRAGRGVRLELHHRHYKNLGSETLTDVLLLCRPCHLDADKHRAFQERKAARERHFENWGAAFYGSDWKQMIDRDEARQRFNRWKERGKN